MSSGLLFFSMLFLHGTHTIITRLITIAHALISTIQWSRSTFTWHSRHVNCTRHALYYIATGKQCVARNYDPLSTRKLHGQIHAPLAATMLPLLLTNSIHSHFKAILFYLKLNKISIKLKINISAECNIQKYFIVLPVVRMIDFDRINIAKYI